MSKPLLKEYLYFLQNNDSLHGFVPDIFNLLRKYHLEHYIQTYIVSKVFPVKTAWKNIIHTSVLDFATNKRRIRMNTCHDFIRFKNIVDVYCFPGWTAAKTISELYNAYFLAKVVTCVPQTEQRLCTNCNLNFIDTIQHFVISCSCNNELRDSFWTKILDTFGIETFVYLDNMYNNNNHDELLHVILGNRPDALMNCFDYDNSDSNVFTNICAKFVRDCSKNFFTDP